MSSARRGIVAISVTGMLWATIGISVRLLQDHADLDSAVILFWRLVIATGALALLVGACVSSEVDVGYKAPAVRPDAAANPVVAVGRFGDTRKFESTYLGAIRGGFGNPLKKLFTPVPVSEVVAQSFRDGLTARGLLSAASDAPYTLSGVVEPSGGVVVPSPGSVVPVPSPGSLVPSSSPRTGNRSSPDSRAASTATTDALSSMPKP